jgi:YHS domain-containing protein
VIEAQHPASLLFQLSACLQQPLSSSGILITRREPMPIDPVCKMHVDIQDAAGSHDYHAEIVYFCSLDCKKEFEKDPEKYMRGMSDEEVMAS